MAAELDYLTRDELLAIIAEQRRVIADLQRRVTALEERLKGPPAGGAGMPGNKPATVPRRERKEQRARRDQGFARRRLPPTEQVDHVQEACPDCGTALQGGWVQRTREVIELPVTPVRVIAHRFLGRRCPRCGRTCVPPATLGEAVVGKHRFGVRLVSLIATLRQDARLPLATIQRFLAALYGVSVSVGALVRLLAGVAARAAPVVTALRDQVRASPVVHADETGWREDGKNGYVWTFSTPSVRYFVRRGRSKAVVDEVLGPDFQGVLVSDFYAAYDHYDGLHQRCWAHLLREVHDLVRLYPDDAALRAWAQQVQAVFAAGKAVTTSDRCARRRQQQRLSAQLLAACQPYVADQVAVQGKLCRRIARYLGELLTFVGDPAVPADNNPAERSLRPLVGQRKISGGTRSPQGTDIAMTLATLFSTWRLQGLNPLLACRSLLTSTQL